VFCLCIKKENKNIVRLHTKSASADPGKQAKKKEKQNTMLRMLKHKV
jgi:hypothetical protein